MVEDSRKKRYFWLQLKEDFFEDDTIQWLEEQRPNGSKYALFYLKLCLKSLRTDGMLYRTVGEYIIPYSIGKLAEITRTEADTVRSALVLLERVGMVERLDNETLYMAQIKEMVGSETMFAKQKRELRATKNGILKEPNNQKETMSQECLKNVSQSIESRDKSLEFRDKRIDKPSPPKKTTLSDDFDKLWSIYPRKERKKDAFNAYKRAVKKGVTNRQIQDGIVAYNKFIEVKDTEKGFIAQGGTWFNQERWTDKYDLTPDQKKRYNQFDGENDRNSYEVPF